MCSQTCDRQHFTNLDVWCDECRTEFEQFVDDQCQLATLSTQHHQHNATLPATDAERRAWLDVQAPLAEQPERVLDSMPCPLCMGQKEIKIHGATASDGSPWIDCPWCGGVGEVPDSIEWAAPNLSERRVG
jgi:hypothetical protein